jgi:hypothetical protein
MHERTLTRIDIWRAIGVVAAVLVLALAAILLYASPDSSDVKFSIDGLQSRSPLGTPPRAEREFKLTMEVPADRTDLNNDWLREAQSSVSRALIEDLALRVWAAPGLTGNPYEVDAESTQIVMRDFYIDSQNDDLLDNAIAMRLRYRFDNADGLDGHEAAPTVRRHFPFRAEVQAKVDRDELGDGFSVSNESRLEFRVEASPFSDGGLPPPAPWPLDDVLPIALSGLFEDLPTTPGALLARALDETGLSGQIDLKVTLVAVSSRTRLHMNMVTEYGSGPNPEQAFILSLDRTDVYDGPGYMEYLEIARLGNIPRPRPVGTFYEMEIEFERNVSTMLDEVIAGGGSASASLLRDAFIEDQQRVREVVGDVFAAMDIRTSGGNRSKYQRASDLLAP